MSARLGLLCIFDVPFACRFTRRAPTLLRRGLELRGIVVELLFNDAVAAPFLMRQFVEQPILTGYLSSRTPN
jgi:hypothetical protein